jgi:hypothetical protein
MATHQGFIDQNSQLYPGGSDIYIRNQQRRAWGYSTPQSGVRAVEQDAQRVGYDPHPMTIDQDPTIDPVEMARQQQARDRQNYLDFNPNAAQEEAAHQQSTTSWGANKGMDSVHNYAGDIRALISWLSGIFGRR